MKLEFQKISTAYGKKAVLEDISFAVESGTITVLLGRNGVGKTTLLRCLTGRKKPEKGTILLDGQDATRLTPDQRSRMVAFLPQELPAPGVTVWELAAFGRAPRLGLAGKLQKEDAQAVDTALSAVGMETYAHRLVDSLSGGERKKAFLAMILAQDTPLVVLDEPTAHLDAAGRFELLGLLERLCRDTGKSFLVVMHELPEALGFADRVAVLHEGGLAFHGTPEEFLAQGVAERCFGIRLWGDPQGGYTVLPLQ